MKICSYWIRVLFGWHNTIDERDLHETILKTALYLASAQSRRTMIRL
ncbi:MAG: hypothetical protein ACRERE_01555 [Candidatus Entotheonellia bacterium]